MSHLHSVRTPVAAIVLGAALAGQVKAEDDIVTDRPDVSESSEVVGKGLLQVETSVVSLRDDLAGTRLHVLNTPTLLRNCRKVRASG
jgi:hypothetical protein